MIILQTGQVPLCTLEIDIGLLIINDSTFPALAPFEQFVITGNTLIIQ